MLLHSFSHLNHLISSSTKLTEIIIGISLALKFGGKGRNGGAIELLHSSPPL